MRSEVELQNTRPPMLKRLSSPTKPAAAVAVTHRVLPLDSTGFGRLLRLTVQACETFYDSVKEIAEQWTDRVHVCVPFEPDSNLICIALNPAGNTSVAAMNPFARAVFCQSARSCTSSVPTESLMRFSELSTESSTGNTSYRSRCGVSFNLLCKFAATATLDRLNPQESP